MSNPTMKREDLERCLHQAAQRYRASGDPKDRQEMVAWSVQLIDERNLEILETALVHSPDAVRIALQQLEARSANKLPFDQFRDAFGHKNKTALQAALTGIKQALGKT